MQSPRSLLWKLLLPILWCGPAQAQDPSPPEKPPGAPPAPISSPVDKQAPDRLPIPGDQVPARVAPVPPSPAAAPVDAKAELEKLQGPWDCVDWVYNGGRPAHNGRIYSSRYEENRITLFNQGKEYRHGLVTLDPSRTPMAMNTWDLDGPFADRTNRGIYALDGDTLKVCIALDAAGDRPSDFTSEVGSRRLLITYRRRQP